MALFRLISACFLGMCLLGTEANASPEAPTVGEVVQSVKATYADTSSVRAEFSQVRRDNAMGTEERQHGRIAFERPRKLRVETGDMGKPVRFVLVSDGNLTWAYDVLGKVVNQLPDLGGEASAGGMGISLDDLSHIDQLFDVTLVPEKPPGRPSYTIHLVPKQPGAVKSMDLTVSKQKFVLQDLVIVDPFDNVTQMTFTMVLMNKDIPDSEFTFVAPAGVQLIKAGGI